MAQSSCSQILTGASPLLIWQERHSVVSPIISLSLSLFQKRHHCQHKAATSSNINFTKWSSTKDLFWDRIELLELTLCPKHLGITPGWARRNSDSSFAFTNAETKQRRKTQAYFLLLVSLVKQEQGQYYLLQTVKFPLRKISVHKSIMFLWASHF